jgi:hypothetical protein
MTDAGRQWLAAQALPATAREQITVGVAMIEALDLQLAPIDKQLRAYARRQPGCRVLMGQFGVGEMTAVTILAELGDARRFSSSRDAARYAGLDVTVHQSDCRRAPSIRRERELARFRSHPVRHRTTLKNRIHATVITFRHPCPVSDLFVPAGRELLDRLEIPEPWRRNVDVSLGLTRQRLRRSWRSCVAPPMTEMAGECER